MATVLFVHGTGVREPSFLQTYALIQTAFRKYRIRHALRPCLWGDERGSRPPRYAVPASMPASAAARNDAGDRARWELLYRDPVFELMLLRERPSVESAGPTAEADAAWQTIAECRLSPATNTFLETFALRDYWERAKEVVFEDGVAQDAFMRPGQPIGEGAAAVARALVASMIAAATEDDRPVLDARHRDQLVGAIVEDWGMVRAGLSAYFLRVASEIAGRAGTRWLVQRRGTLSATASPVPGDVLLYQARGAKIREYIAEQIRRTEDDVILLAHSLGGVACVDLLAMELLPHVTALVTVGSQAPLLFEIGALVGVEPGSELRLDFPRWLNLYDLNDVLSYVAAPVFGSREGRIVDEQIESRQPFPQAHGAYWSNEKTWNVFRGFVS